MCENEHYYWERSEFLSFGALPKCHCWGDGGENSIIHESGKILLPPSPNWFVCDAVDSRNEDSLLITAAFKNIVVYHLNPAHRLPDILKVIPYKGEKVISLRLQPRASDVDYGHAVASVGDEGSVRIHNIHTGTLTAQHNVHKETGVLGVCWGSVGDESVVVSVGGEGKMVVWQPKYDVTKIFTYKNLHALCLVEADPKDPTRALIAADRSIALVTLKDGKVLFNLHGHDYQIYCLRWYLGDGCPFTNDPPVTNSRAEAMMADKKKSTTTTAKEKEKGTGSGSDNWRGAGSSVPESTGPFFASSDYGRNVFFWDLNTKKYVTKFNVPQSASGYKKQPAGKDRSSGKQHIPLAWHGTHLLTSTIRGELLQWTIEGGRAHSKPLHHLHNRALYTIHVLGNKAITSGQDRLLQGYDLSTSSHIFTFPTLGGCATSLSFCPHDANRLAIGSQENNIRIINFSSEVPLQVFTVYQNIKGKIFSLCWHPEHDGRLLFGTGSGQVGWTDVSSGRTTTFAYYHQKSVYKVEWAPPVCPDVLGVKEPWCAYSFGDKEIVVRSTTTPMADPIRLHTILPNSEASKIPKDITEFSFSPDYKFLAIGCLDGQVCVVRRSDLVVVVRMTVVRKAIQHLLWQPPSVDTPYDTTTTTTYTLAVASNETKVHLFLLDSVLNGDKIGQVLTQSSRELCGHESRVVWLAWSPHTPTTLGSASYDHTIQLWDTTTGEPLVNYGGHISRVFRVEFSPIDPDLVYSLAEENSVHTWQPSLQTTRTSADSNAVLKDFKKGVAAATTTTATAKISAEDSGAAQDEKEKRPVGGDLGKGSSTGTSSGGGGSYNNYDSGPTTNKKTQPLKSFFPKLHSVASRKKSFHHLLILNMLALQEAADQGGGVGAREGENASAMEEDLEEETTVDEATTEDEVDVLRTVGQTCDKFRCLLEKDSEMATPEEFNYVLNLYGGTEKMDSLLAEEIVSHESRGNSGHAGLMHCWRGTLDQHIQWAARHHKLTPFLVAAAPQVSHKLWETACEAYAEQLVEEGEVIAGATYLVNINKAEEAVHMLTSHKHFREAYAVTRCRLPYNKDLLAQVVGKWVSCTIYEGNYDLAATLQLSQGEIENAARTLSRRLDPGSLLTAGQLYRAAGCEELAAATGVAALKEVALRQELDRVDSFLEIMPQLKWFGAVASCLRVLVGAVRQVGKEGRYCYLIKPGHPLDHVEQDAASAKYKIPARDGKTSGNGIVVDENGADKKLNGDTDSEKGSDQLEPSAETANKEAGEDVTPGMNGSTNREMKEGAGESQRTSPETEAAQRTTVLERVRIEWEARGITADQYPEIYQAILDNFATQHMPTSLKQLWLLVSVSITQSLVAGSGELRATHLTTALQHTLTWAKLDQIFHLTHMLLPRGSQDLSSLAPILTSLEDPSSTPAVRTLCQLYHLAELSMVHSHVLSPESWPLLKSAEGEAGEATHNHESSDQAASHNHESSDQAASHNQEQVPEVLSDGNSNSHPDSDSDVKPKDPVSASTDNTSTSEGLGAISAKMANLDIVENLQECDLTQTGSVFQLPNSKPTLLATLNSSLDRLSQNSEFKMDLGSGLTHANKLVVDIVNQLRSKGGCSEEEMQMLMAKVASQ